MYSPAAPMPDTFLSPPLVGEGQEQAISTFLRQSVSGGRRLCWTATSLVPGCPGVCLPPAPVTSGGCATCEWEQLPFPSVTSGQDPDAPNGSVTVAGSSQRAFTGTGIVLQSL